ncbi:MAG: hypothetical protein E7I55_05840 [Acinetobacter ursingii]|nr:hypothetical protein [Acinetobacter ursingii]
MKTVSEITKAVETQNAIIYIDSAIVQIETILKKMDDHDMKIMIQHHLHTMQDCIKTLEKHVLDQ